MSNQPIILSKATAIKRILAFIYDLFLIIPLMMLATMIWLPFNNGIAIEPGNPLYPFMIAGAVILMPILFYSYFWYKGGQTLGMRSWKLRIVSSTGTPLTRSQSVMRAILLVLTLASIPLGLYTASILPSKPQAMIFSAVSALAILGLSLTFTQKRTSYIDLLTQTRIVQLPKT